MLFPYTYHIANGSWGGLLYKIRYNVHDVCIAFPLFDRETTLYICMSARPFGYFVFITFNKENYHDYCFM